MRFGQLCWQHSSNNVFCYRHCQTAYSTSSETLFFADGIFLASLRKAYLEQLQQEWNVRLKHALRLNLNKKIFHERPQRSKHYQRYGMASPISAIWLK